MADVSLHRCYIALSLSLQLIIAPKRLLTCSARNILRTRLASIQVGQKTRLDIHVLLAKGSNLRLSVMHVLVEPLNVPDAEEWVGMVMDVAYAGESSGRSGSMGKVDQGEINKLMP
jgi:hypothetical protein